MEEKILQFSKIIGVDISGSLISACICEYSLDNHSVTCCEPHFVRATPSFSREKYDKNFETYLEDFIKVIQDTILEVRDDYVKRDEFSSTSEWDELPIGISFSGQINYNGDVFSASSIFGPENPKALNLIREIKMKPTLKKNPIFVLNNISAASWEYGAEKPYHRFLTLHIGAGVGSKVFDNIKKEVIIDSRGLAGELGHIYIPKPPHLKDYTFICNCGKENHLAAFILPEGFRRLYNLYSKGENCSGNIFTDINKNFDQFGKLIIDDLVDLIGRMISYIILAIGIDKVIIKGGQFYKFDLNVRQYYIENLNKTIYRDLKDYYHTVEPMDFIDSMLIFKDRDGKRNITPEEADKEDRLDSIKGIVRYIIHYYESNYRVTKAYYYSCPSFLLSYKYDIFYPVIRSENIFDSKNNLLDKLVGQRKILIIIDENYIRKVNHDFYNRVVSYFSLIGKKVCEDKHKITEKNFENYDIIIEMITPVSDGHIIAEKKDMIHVEKIIDWAQKYQLPRDGILVAIGGGVILDTVGFAAQQFRRSIEYVKIPTTLIGQIDAGIGVKVGVNFGDKKNLIGAFYPPKFVVNDIHFLFTLNDRELMCGVAEILKMGIICSSEIIHDLETIQQVSGAALRDNPQLRERFIHVMDLSIETMLEELQKNLFEKELKRIVDFGHTFSPCIESLSDYRIPHGFAVAIDMYICIIIAEELKLIDIELKNRYLDLLKKYDLLFNPILGAIMGKAEEEFLTGYHDKIFSDSINKILQHRGGNLNLVVPFEKVGRSGFVNLDHCPALNSQDYVKITSVAELKAAYDKALTALNTEKSIKRTF